MEDLGWAGMRIVPTFQGFGSKLQAGVRGSSDAVAHSERFGTGFGTRAAGSIRSKLSESAKYIVGPLIAAFAVERIGATIGESIKAASDLQAAQARSNLIFGKGAHVVDEFGDHAAKALGLSHLAALNAATGFGLIGQQMDLTDRQNVRFSERFTRTADDLAAFNHSDPAAAFTAVQRGLAGATRGLKPYGVLIDSTTIKAEALADGILKPVKNQAAIHAAQVRVLSDQTAYTAAIAAHGKESIEAQKASAALGLAQNSLNTATAGAIPTLTTQQKMLAASKLIMSQTTQQQGAFARSSHNLYGQQRQLTASWDNAKDHLGKGLLPVATDFVHAINQHVIPAVSHASYWFEKKGGPAIHHFEHELDPLVQSALPALGTGLKDAYDAGKQLLPIATGIFQAFNSLPSWAQKAVVVGGAAGFIGKKAGILGASAGTELATLARPLPVFVTNEGFGPGPGGVVSGAKTGVALTEGEAAAAATAGAAAAKGFLPRLLGAAFEAPALLSLVNNKKAESGGQTPIYLTKADFLRQFAGATTVPSASTLSIYGRNGITPDRARSLLNIPNLTSTSTHVDALKASLAKVSHETDLIGPRADAAFGATSHGANTASRDIGGLIDKLDAVKPKPIIFTVQDQAVIDALTRIRNAHPVLAVQERIYGPGGGIGHPGDGGSGKAAGGGASGGSAAGGRRSGTNVHVHLDRLRIDRDGRVSGTVRSEVEEDGRFYRQQTEAGHR
jgi:hypothetical protein